MHDYQNLLAQNRLLSEEVKRRVDHLAAINTVAASVSQSLDLNETLTTALRTVLDITGAEAGGISLIDRAANEVVMRAQAGWTQDFVQSNPMRIPIGKGMSGQVILNDDVVVDNDLDGSKPLAVPRFYDEPFRSIVMAPMHARGNVIGILSIMSSRPNSFDDSVISVLRVIADTVGVALDNARLYETSVENQHRLGAVLQSTADGIIATDQNGAIRLVNQAAVDMLVVDSEVLIGQPLRAAPVQQRIREALTFALSGGDRQRAFRVSAESGRMLSVIVSPVYVESQVDQRVVADGWVIVLQDVTHLHEAELSRTQFIQAAAHDMQNPLGVTMNALEMLKRRLDQRGSETDEIIEIAASGITRIQALIDDLLDLENMQSGIGFNFEQIDLGELVYEVSAEIKPLLDTRALSYHVEFEQDVPLISADRRWLARALLNYLDNAIKYAPYGGDVLLRVYVLDALLHLEVIDNGPGIAVEAQARLFERFYRAAGSERAPGTGLGLAIVKSVAEAHGGGVYVQSAPNAGSAFGMTLMLQPLMES